MGGPPPRPASTLGEYRREASLEDVRVSPWRPRSAIDIGADFDVLLSEGECCPVTGLRHRSGGASVLRSHRSFGSQAYLGSQKSALNLSHVVPPDACEPKKLYPLELLKETRLPPDVDREAVERHLSKDEFESAFGMNAEQFYLLPIWNRNELKIRLGLNC